MYKLPRYVLTYCYQQHCNSRVNPIQHFVKDNEFIIINFYESKIYSEYLVNLVTVLLLKGSFAYFGFCLKL